MRNIIILSAPLVLVSACASTDPLYQSGRWQPSGTNDRNLAIQVADPADLLHGRQGTGSDGLVAAAAVQRLRMDQVKKLPDSGLAQITVSSSPAASDVTTTTENGGL